MISSKVLIINPQHGLGNRLRAIASAYSIAKANNLTFLIHWIPDDHCNCLLSDIITNSDYFGKIITDISNNEYSSMKVYNYMTTESDEKNKIIDLHEKTIYCKSNCILQHPNNFTHFSSFFSSLKFNPMVLRYISHFQVSNYIGMHIRIEESDKNYENNENNWTIQEHEIMSSHRQMSKMECFMNQINFLLHKNPKQLFFVSSNDKYVLTHLRDVYGSKIQFLNRKVFDRSASQIQFAMADIYLLASCKQFYGSYWSSFSEIVTYFQTSSKRKMNVFSNSFRSNKKIQQTMMNKNIFGKHVQSGNSIVTACMNRNENLVKAIPSWLRASKVDEIVIIDWSSKIPVQQSLKHIRDIRVKIYRVTNAEKWSICQSMNLAIKCASYENIYKLDCDDVIDTLMIINHPLDDSCFYRGNWEHAKNENQMQINGKMFCKYQNLIRVNGYNENITTYGWDDDDLYIRLSSFLQCKYVNIKMFYFIQHDDSLRTTNTSLPKKTSTVLNQILAYHNKLTEWKDICLQNEYRRISNDSFKIQSKYYTDISFVNSHTIQKTENYLFENKH